MCALLKAWTALLAIDRKRTSAHQPVQQHPQSTHNKGWVAFTEESPSRFQLVKYEVKTGGDRLRECTLIFVRCSIYCTGSRRHAAICNCSPATVCIRSFNKIYFHFAIDTKPARWANDRRGNLSTAYFDHTCALRHHLSAELVSKNG